MPTVCFSRDGDRRGMEELTTDHVDVLCQAAVNLCRGQAHLGGARRHQGQKAELSL